jgi:hypothetical protein
MADTASTRADPSGSCNTHCVLDCTFWLNHVCATCAAALANGPVPPRDYAAVDARQPHAPHRSNGQSCAHARGRAAPTRADRSIPAAQRKVQTEAIEVRPVALLICLEGFQISRKLLRVGPQPAPLHKPQQGQEFCILARAENVRCCIHTPVTGRSRQRRQANVRARRRLNIIESQKLGRVIRRVGSSSRGTFGLSIPSCWGFMGEGGPPPEVKSVRP